MAQSGQQGVASEDGAVTVSSRRFGTHQVPADRVLLFDEGLVGFADARRFALLEPSRPGSPFHYLVCLDLPELGFVVADPEVLVPGYRAEVPPPLDAEGPLVVLVLVTVPADPLAMTANLMAPLVVDPTTRRGRQLVLDTGRWPTRHPLLARPAAGDRQP